MALGDGIRRNIAMVEPSERALLRNAFIELNRRFFPGTRDQDPPGGVSQWFKQDEIHKATHVHDGPEFLPWHREIVNQLEEMLRQINPQLSLHYWDWTQNPKAIPNANLGGRQRGTLNLFTSDFMGSDNGEIGEPWKSARYYVPGANPNRDGVGGTAADPPLTVTRVVSGSHASPSDDTNIVNAADYPTMRLRLEAVHDAMHNFVNMGDRHTSFRDPFVFLLHSNVDRLFARWQTNDAGLGRLNPNTVYGSESGLLDEKIKPWSGEHPFVRPWAAPDSQPIVKTYKHPSVVAPPRYDTNLFDLVSIRSISFPNVFLRMDGTGVGQPTSPGGGRVNGQFGAHSLEKFKLIPQGDGIVAIGSTAFPNVFLRMDGRGVTRSTPNGGGRVNCQFGAQSFEKFNLIPQGDGTVAIGSTVFRNVFLRLDGTGVTQLRDAGGGAANCQFGVGGFVPAVPFEKFILVPTSL